MGLGGASVGASLGAQLLGPASANPVMRYRGSGYRPDPGTGLRQLPARSGSQPGTGRHLRGGGRDDILPPGAADRADHPLPGSRSLERQGQGQMTRTAMKRGIRDHAHALPVLAILGLAVSGCGQTMTLLETKVLPSRLRPLRGENFPRPTRVPRSMIPDCTSSPRSSRPGPCSRRRAGPLRARFSAGSRCCPRPGRCFLTEWVLTSRSRGCRQS